MICRLLFLLPLTFLFLNTGFSQSKPTVTKVIQGVPSDLSLETLLIPRYDFWDPEDAPKGAPPSVVVRYNREAKKANTTIDGIAQKYYSTKYKMADIKEVEAMKAQGYKYFMDMVLMPKGMREAEPRAMVPSFIKFGETYKMFNNRYTQFNYYFYIRDLETNEAYVTTRLKGNFDVYTSMRIFFKQVSKDMLAGGASRD
ncbi:MAG: hypothetical protein MRZ79_08535 [Bacteroidia bacterium]|nr:hypothetical protein [Bacteroidia bacterium]